MIEREAKFQVDRPLIAAVIYNRLKKGMPLQIDATVEYALGANGPANVGYLYYVADSSGHNHYATTYQEFLQLRAKYTG